MIIHFVAQEFEYSMITPDARRIDISDETYDPLSGINNFHSFFGRIDGRAEREIMRLDTSGVKKAFWDRDEFLAALRELCRDDVYVQASDWYSMKIMFVRKDDHDAFAARMEVEKPGWRVTLPQEFEIVVRNFLVGTLDVDHHQYEQVLSDGHYHYLFREQTVAELVEIKFAHSKPDDHNRPKPSLQAAYAAIAGTTNIAPPEAVAA